MAQYSFAQLEKLWQQAGGSAASAPVAAAIALAESGGRTDALNNNPKTGDYSVGLWQINYYGSLASGRTQQFGPPQQLISNPADNAAAAVAISNGGTNFSPWRTYTSGAYAQNLPGGAAQSAPASPYQTGPRPSGNAQADQVSLTSGVEGALALGPDFVIGGVGSTFHGIFSFLGSAANAAKDAVSLFAWLVSPKHWAQALEIVVGVGLLATGLVYLGGGSPGAGVAGLAAPEIAPETKRLFSAPAGARAAA